MITLFPWRSSRAPVFALAACALAMLGACARIAPVGGVEFGWPLTVDRTAGRVNTYGNDGAGESTNLTLRFGAAFESDSLLPAGMTLSPRAALAISNGRFKAYPFRFDDPAAAEPISTRSYDVYSTLSVLQLDAPVLFALGDAFVGIGPWASYRVSSGFIQTEHIEGPAGFTYPDGETSRTTETGETLGSERLRVGALVSIGTAFDLFTTMKLRPELYGRVDFMSLSAGLAERSLSAGVTVAFMAMPETPQRPITEPVATLAVLIDSAPRAPVASIELRLADASPMISTGTLERLEVPATPVIPFEHNSDRLPIATTPETAARFGIDSLARLNPEELTSRTLDIVGMRLRDNPSSTLTLRGGRLPDEDRSLSSSRALAVREYLVRVWSIDSARLRVSRDASSKAEAQLGLDAAIAVPIVTRWVTRNYSAPRVALLHSIDAPAGVRYWEIALRQGDRIVARASEGNGDSVLSADITLAGGLLPVIAELTLIDSSGARAIARDTLALRENAVHGSIARERREVVIAAGENLSERAGDIAATIREGAIVTLGRMGGARLDGHTPVRLASLLLADLQRRGIHIGGLRVADNPETRVPGALAGALRVIVEQDYSEKGD